MIQGQFSVCADDICHAYRVPGSRWWRWCRCSDALGRHQPWLSGVVVSLGPEDDNLMMRTESHNIIFNLSAGGWAGRRRRRLYVAGMNVDLRPEICFGV